MTEEQKYSELLKALGEALKEKNDLISIQNYKIESLTAKIKELEKR